MIAILLRGLVGGLSFFGITAIGVAIYFFFVGSAPPSFAMMSKILGVAFVIGFVYGQFK